MTAAAIKSARAIAGPKFIPCSFDVLSQADFRNNCQILIYLRFFCRMSRQPSGNYDADELPPQATYRSASRPQLEQTHDPTVDSKWRFSHLHFGTLWPVARAFVSAMAFSNSVSLTVCLNMLSSPASSLSVGVRLKTNSTLVGSEGLC